MASPPYSSTASSPPGPTPLSLPRQRPPTNGLGLPQKHRKLSTASSQPTSAHPLRQTSFPPSEAGSYSRDGFSPAESLDSLDDADIRSAVGDNAEPSKKRKRGEKRPRGRPPKDPRAQHSKRGVESTNGSEVPRREGDEEEDDEEDEDEGDGVLGASRAAGDFSLLPAEMDRDKQRKFLFREAVPPAHQARYDSFNTVKLRPADVRRLVNQTLSQSVPANVVTVVGSYTKMFAGMLVEAARGVQAERMAVKEKRPDGEQNAAWERLRGMMEPPEVEWESESEDDEDSGEEEEMHEKADGETNGEVDKEMNGKADADSDVEEKVETNGDTKRQGLPDGDPDSADEKSGEETTAIAALPNGKDRGNKSRAKKVKISHPDPLDTSLPEHDFAHAEPGAWGLGQFIEDCDRGPLQPDHLREALRRYRRSRAGGSVGYTGISLEGREGVAPRMGGRKLFR